jgi:hypothetical protein
MGNGPKIGDLVAAFERAVSEGRRLAFQDALRQILMAHGWDGERGEFHSYDTPKLLADVTGLVFAASERGRA